MRRIAVAGSLAAVALAGAAGVAVAAVAGHPATAPPQAALTTTLDATAHDGTDTGTAADPASSDPAAGSAAGQPGGTASTASGSSTEGSTTTGGIGTTADVTGTADSTGPASGCGENGWQPRMQGRPVGFEGGDRAGDYLWHGLDGFHLRLTHRGDRRDVFTGYIHADTAMALRPVRLEGRDAAWLSADRKTLGFRFYDYGHIDGVDFVTRCASRLTVSGLTMDGHPLPAGRVYLGRYRLHPAQVPFTIDRRPSA